MVDDTKINLKRIELKIEYKKGEYITLTSFIEKMGLNEIIMETDDKFFKYRLFNEIIKVLIKFNAIKEAGKEIIVEKEKGKRGRKAIVYKVIKNISMVWIIEP